MNQLGANLGQLGFNLGQLGGNFGHEVPLVGINKTGLTKRSLVVRILLARCGQFGRHDGSLLIDILYIGIVDVVEKFSLVATARNIQICTIMNDDNKLTSNCGVPPTSMRPRRLPCSRSFLVNARVSTPYMAGTP